MSAMRMFCWNPGRQGGGYAKFPLIVSERFKFDCYILRYPPFFALPPHKDECPDGYEHHRINIRLLGEARYFEEHPDRPWWLNASIKRILRIRPDLKTHAVMNGPKWTYTLSIGWLRRAK